MPGPLGKVLLSGKSYGSDKHYGSLVSGEAYYN